MKYIFKIATYLLAAFGALCLYEMISREITPQDSDILNDEA